MSEDEKLSVSLYGVVKGMHDVVTLPTHNTLKKTLIFSALLTACSGLSTLLGFYTFISWYGALLCTILLGILLLIERSENHALLEVYRNARLSIKKAAQRAKTAGANTLNARHSGGGLFAKAGTGTGKRSHAKQSAKRSRKSSK